MSKRQRQSEGDQSGCELVFEKRSRVSGGNHELDSGNNEQFRKRLGDGRGRAAKRTCLSSASPTPAFLQEPINQFALVPHQPMPLVARSLTDRTPMQNLAIVPYNAEPLGFSGFQPVSKCTIEQLESDDEDCDEEMEVESSS